VLQIAHRMWSPDETPCEGKHYRLVRPLNSPNSVQHPHPPILIAGSGERKTLRLVARYGDACNLFDLPGTRFGDDIPRKLDILRSHCADVGRDYLDIEKTVATRFDPDGDPEALVAHLADLAAIGIDHALVGTLDTPWTEKALATLADHLPAIAAIPVNRS
jgi:hypothetical protein